MTVMAMILYRRRTNRRLINRGRGRGIHDHSDHQGYARLPRLRQKRDSGRFVCRQAVLDHARQ